MNDSGVLSEGRLINTDLKVSTGVHEMFKLCSRGKSSYYALTPKSSRSRGQCQDITGTVLSSTVNGFSTKGQTGPPHNLNQDM